MESSNLTDILAQLKHIVASGAFFYVLIAVNVVIFVWEALPYLPSKFILLISVVMGALLYPRFIARGSVPPQFPDPVLVLVIEGMAGGLISFILHRAVVKLTRAKFDWPPEEPVKPPLPNPIPTPDVPQAPVN